MNDIPKILVVDDNQKNLEIVSRYLKEEGYKIALAENGKDALEILKVSTFDLILLDIMMPEIDGFEVCIQIRRNPDYDDIPILFLTAKVEKADLLRGFEIGAQDYITKPFDSQELMARVKTHIELKQNKDALKKLNQVLDDKVKERTQELEKANAKLLNLDDAKINFLRIISHEIRTPLNGIKGFTTYLKMQNESKELIRFFDLLENSVNRLENFSKLAMNITQLQLNRYEIRLSKISLNDEFNFIFNELDSIIKEKNITLNRSELTEEKIISGDPRLIKRALGILINNAIKHTAENSTLELKCRLEKDYQVFILKDHGPGFPPELVAGEFKLFLTEDKHVNLNMGLDIPYVNLIMLAHNGKINLKNHDSGGLVELYFPAIKD